MTGWLVILAVPYAAYCMMQTARDVRRRSWPMASWGAVLSLGLLWLLFSLLTVRSY